MPSSDSAKTTFYCSFCGKSQHEVKQLFAGPTVFICDKCVGQCMDIIAEKFYGGFVVTASTEFRNSLKEVRVSSRKELIDLLGFGTKVSLDGSQIIDEMCNALFRRTETRRELANAEAKRQSEIRRVEGEMQRQQKEAQKELNARLAPLRRRLEGLRGSSLGPSMPVITALMPEK